MSGYLRRRRSATILGTLALLAFNGWAASAEAETFTVTTNADGGKGSLRAALTKAGKADESDTVRLKVEGTIRLKTELPTVEAPVQIKGPGAKKLSVRPVPEAQDAEIYFLRFSAGQSSVSGLTVSAFKGGYYGAIANLQDSDLTLRSVRFIGNSAYYQGGGVGSTGALRVSKSTFEGNHASYEGGAIFACCGGLDISRTTFEGNSAGVEGQTGLAGALSTNGPTTVDNSTFANNFTIGQQQFGGALAIQSNVEMSNSTLVGNSSQHGATVYIGSGAGGVFTSSIFSGPQGDTNCEGSSQFLVTGGHSLISDNSCTWDSPEAGDQIGVEPLLKDLDFYGGPTKTFALKALSPAIDAGTAADGVKTDQRGLRRTVDRPSVTDASGSDGTDIGAFELQP